MGNSKGVLISFSYVIVSIKKNTFLLFWSLQSFKIFLIELVDSLLTFVDGNVKQQTAVVFVHPSGFVEISKSYKYCE